MVQNSFDRGPEGWCSYDYHRSVVDRGVNVFILTVWERSGGVGGTGYVWSNETRWSVDTPESPMSVLPFIIYRSWVGLEPVDLVDAEVSVYLRGDGLELDGAACYFWVHGRGGRWHFNSRPLDIGYGEWNSEPNVFTLRSNEALWYRSWAAGLDDPPPLDDILSQCDGYGFSFVGFGQEPRGRLSMDELEIKLS